jgi:trans-aconitate methyltransferase
MRWDAEKYDSVRAPQIDAGRELIAMAKVKETDSILDIGCGTGKLTFELARMASQGCVTGIDPSEEMLARARTIRSPFGNILLMQMPAQAIKFRRDFDLVYSNSALQWIKEQEEVITRSFTALRANGRVALQLPTKDFCWGMMENINSAISALSLETVYGKMESPWRFPLKEEMAGFLQKAGFVNINVFYKDYALLFENVNEVLEWGTSAGLRPFLAPLSRKMQERFKYAFAMGFENYRTQKGIEFGFRRLFALAEKR